MVLIISSIDDQSTNDVIDWLIFYNIDFLRISQNDSISYKGVILNDNFFDVTFTIGKEEYNLSDFSAFWYRRSYLKMFFKNLESNTALNRQLNNHLFTEAQEIHKLVKKTIRNKSLNKEEDIYSNKLEVLKLAVEEGLQIPDTLITSNKKDAKEFLRKHNHVITKNFSPGIFINYKGSMLGNSTTLVNKALIDDLPETFYPTLFQQMINKLFELRIFYIDGSFYSSAIFSQNNEKTKLDFRNYDHSKPNRTPPFKLPVEIENKLYSLMKKCEINSGSIDMMVSCNHQYVFLEVNPIGQFSQVSIPCNYYLEKVIAQQLKKISHGTIQ